MIIIELFLVFGLLIHLIIVFFTKKIIGAICHVWLIIISSILDILYMLLYIYYPYEIERYQMVIILVISLIPFLEKRLIRVIMASFIYFLTNFALGGINSIYYTTSQMKPLIMLGILGLTVILGIVYTYFKHYFITSRPLIYEVIIIDKNHKYHLKGFLDTGNFLVDEKLVPVIFINNKNIGTYCKNTMVNSVSSGREIELFKVDFFAIKIKKKFERREVLVAKSNLNYDCMFGLKILGG